MDDPVTAIPALLHGSKTIAVVGLSSNPDRDSYEVAEYLQQHGYRVVPVNPTYAGTRILGEHCYPTLTQAARALSETSAAPIDIVDCFRRPESMPDVAEEAVHIGAKALWMQLGVVNDTAADIARRAGLAVIMDHCMKIEHSRLLAREARRAAGH
ncbi:CoA-binding protein [Oxalobacteraceae bacterium OM1]|nr:CoA-binding protein [Oxalobacteraceae bacterium OM1]